MARVLCLALALTASRAGAPTRGPEFAYRRIKAMPEAGIWLGHVSTTASVHEVALKHAGNGRAGFIPPIGESCPWNGRPGGQLFRIEYYSSNSEVIMGGPGHAGLPDHMLTNNRMVRCTLAGPARPRRAPAAR